MGDQRLKFRDADGGDFDDFVLSGFFFKSDFHLLILEIYNNLLRLVDSWTEKQ